MAMMPVIASSGQKLCVLMATAPSARAMIAKAASSGFKPGPEFFSGSADSSCMGGAVFRTDRLVFSDLFAGMESLGN
jgi:hypothetical protein